MPKDNYAVEIMALAEADLEGIYDYYFEVSQEREIAEKVTGQLKKAILGLDFMPASHPMARDTRLRMEGIRNLIVWEYVILFLIDENNKTVSVVRVFHGKMDYQKYL